MEEGEDEDVFVDDDVFIFVGQGPRRSSPKRKQRDLTDGSGDDAAALQNKNTKTAKHASKTRATSTRSGFPSKNKKTALSPNATPEEEEEGEV